MALNFQAIVDAVASYAEATGEFDTVNMHEPKAKPGNGVTCSVWVGEISPLGAASGLNVVSGLIELSMRVQTPFKQQPEDGIDPLVMQAVGALMTAFAGGFTMAGVVRNVDLLGEHSQGLRAKAGYINQDGTVYRVMDVMLPLIVNDLFPEVP